MKRSLLLIVNSPYSQHSFNESEDHIKGKIRVAGIIDKYLEERKKIFWSVDTIYEYEFGPIFKNEDSITPTKYYADIFVDVHWPITQYHEEHKKLVIEIDGDCNHGSHRMRKKDEFRDELLKEHFGCNVVRFNMYWLCGNVKKHLEPLTIAEILQECQVSKIFGV